MPEASRKQALSPALTLAVILLCGAGAGLINGLLGTGGGILLICLMRRLPPDRTPFSPLTPDAGDRDIYAAALAVMLPISIFSALRYARTGALDVAAFTPLILPSIAGGVLGGFLLDRLRVSWLRWLFSLLVLFSGIVMIVRE